MDREQQIRLNFLDEAEEYFDRLESNCLGLAAQKIDPQQIDLILRSAHSIKGGAAMMGFKILSQVAHHLEDFFKILRVRYGSKRITMEVETLLLQGVDCLRHINSLHRQGKEIADAEILNLTQPIFAELRQHLGSLAAEDEDALIAQQEHINPALLVFEEGVNTILERFAQQLDQLEEGELAQELTSTADELIGFGHMANLTAFIQLCQSIQQQAITVSPSASATLAEEALKIWRRSHALVMRGSIDKLPTSLQDEDATFNGLQSNFELDSLEDHALLSGLQSAFALDSIESDRHLDSDSLEDESLLNGLQSTFELDNTEEDLSSVPLKPDNQTSSPSPDKMVRVPERQLKQFNHLFEQLIIDRNKINFQLKQCQNIISLMGKRMSQMEHSHTQLKQWYNLTAIDQEPKVQAQSALNSAISPVPKQRDRSDRFDALEMDRYTNLHVICQEQIETIIQLQEVTKDIDLGFKELNQAIRDFNYTTKSMQGNVTRTQMLPFAEVVKRFPRVIRDLNLQFNKQVELQIMGANTLLDRSVIDALHDPLMHLLRNAFDHGIEDSETRLAQGKAPSGIITIQASNQGTSTVITLRDDGAGISQSKIRARLMKMGLSPMEVEQIPATKLLDFIFEPGFTTAGKVTELSGRGVGMDVVRTNLQAIRGDVRVETELGQGTTFTLRVPFTLSILRVAIVEQAGILFAIPAHSIRELMPITPKLSKTSDQLNYIHWQSFKIPLIAIEKTLVHHPSTPSFNLSIRPAIEQTMAIVVKDENLGAAIEINRFWHEQEYTIRPIDSPFPLPPGFISSIIFGDGKAIPLVDPLLLIEACLKHHTESDRSSQKLTETKPLSTSKTILVVDDSINIRRYLSLTLEQAGYRVEQAKDGQEAVDKLLAGLSVQAVICDLEMPRLDGYGVLEEIKGRPKFAELPIAMLTSRSNEKHRQLAMNLGASAYFTKPYNEQELLSKLAELIPGE